MIGSSVNNIGSFCQKSLEAILYNNSRQQVCTTERPQLFGFEVPSCRSCRLRSKKANLEVAMSYLQKWRGFAQSWGPCMPYDFYL